MPYLLEAFQTKKGSRSLGQHDIQQLCLNGHQITDRFNAAPNLRRSFCQQCGAKTITACPHCNSAIKGDYSVPGAVFIGFQTPVPNNCENCGRRFPWISGFRRLNLRKLLYQGKSLAWGKKISVGALILIAGFAFYSIYPSSPNHNNSDKSRYVRQAPNQPKVIVFVHGVDGDSVATWTNDVTRAYWPGLIANDADFGNANIYVLSYPSPVLRKSLSINELGETMRRSLLADKVLDHPEVIFLSHSMGGLVTRAFLLKYREHASKVKMAYFFATPSQGSLMAILV